MTPVISEPISISEINACGNAPYYRSHNLPLMNADYSSVIAIWNHVDHTISEWEGISQSKTAYNLTTSASSTASDCNDVSVFEGILVKKYGDWDHQHANGYILERRDVTLFMNHVDRLLLDLYYDASKSSIPDLEAIAEAYGMTVQDTRVWDKGLFNLDIQIHTRQGGRAAYNIELTEDMADKWLRIEIPIESMEITTSAGGQTSLSSILRHEVKNISIAAETGNRLVYRNLNPNGFNADTPKLFKELGIRIKRLEIHREQ